MLTRQTGQIASPRDVVCNYTTGTTAQTIVFSSVADGCNVVHGVQWSYNTTPASGRLTVSTPSATLLDVDITSSGPGGFIAFLRSGVNESLTVTLAAATATGKLSVQSMIQRGV